VKASLLQTSSCLNQVTQLFTAENKTILESMTS